MSWVMGFRLESYRPLSAMVLAKNVLLTERLSVVVQVNVRCVHIVIKVDGDSGSAVRSAVAIIWQLLETEQLYATIVQARLGAEIDCLAAVRELESWRSSLQKSIL